MRKFLLLAFCALCAFNRAALAGDPAAEALEGAWLVQVGEQARDRFLVVSGAARTENRIVPATAIYGWIDGKGIEVKDWRAEVFGDAIRLTFRTPADSLVGVSLKAEEANAAGEMVVKSGKKFEVRMTRLPPEELQALRAAAAETRKAQKLAPLRVAKDAKIYLVYVGAPDCPGCIRFEASNRNGERLKEITPELLEARYVKAELWSYKDPVTPAALPAELQWLVRPDAAGKLPLRKRGTPFFAAVVDQRVLAQGHGTAALESLVAPAIKRAVEGRRAAN